MMAAFTLQEEETLRRDAGAGGGEEHGAQVPLF